MGIHFFNIKLIKKKQAVQSKAVGDQQQEIRRDCITCVIVPK